MPASSLTVDGNEAATLIAHKVNEVAIIYPITPSSPMGEFADEWSAKGKTNLWGQLPQVIEMQSEAGAIGAVHGSLQAGALTTTFTASQGLLLMIPNLYKIAGELTSYAMHVAARTVATHALSIFGDHSDVMAVRQTGMALLCANSVQETHDLALVAQAATLKSRIPFIHFFDGFRTSHEVAKIDTVSDDVITAMLDSDAIEAHRRRALTPDNPQIRGTAQNPDTFFQAREACNGYYDACPDIVQQAMNQFAELTGRSYQLFDYVGHPEAERVIVMMGSGAETAEETINHLIQQGEKVGLLKVRLYRPFASEAFIAALPATTKRISVLDRTKEPGATGEPLYQDVLTAMMEYGKDRFADLPGIVGGRYGLSSKEFTPAMVKAAFDDLGQATPNNHFTVGITDDVTHLSLPVDESFDIEPDDVVRAVFYGLGADGTVGANKNSIKIIGERTDNYAQGYFVYDSKKSGAITVSHLRFGPRPIQSAYLIRQAGFIACHQFQFLEKYDVLETAEEGATFLLNAPYATENVWDKLPDEVQQTIIDKKLRVFVIDAYKVAGQAGMGQRINTVMQACFFALSGVLPREQAIAQIKKYIEKTYSKKGDEVVRRNFEAVDMSIDNMFELEVPEHVTSVVKMQPMVAEDAPDFIQKVTGVMMAGKGDLLPVSAFPVDGTWPTGTTKYEKRAIAQDIPIWESELCIQCNKCSLVCPHAAIRSKVYAPEALDHAPEAFQSRDYKAKDFKGDKFTIQVAPQDCTGCNLCVGVCPAKDKSNPSRKAINMAPLTEHLETEKENYEFFLDLPPVDRTKILRLDVKGSQMLEPLFEYSGACAGCGETPYVKLVTQLFGDRMIIANATGCSSIYGGNLPTTPYCTTKDGLGPAWANSLFEDNAEFGLGMRLAVESHRAEAQALLKALAPAVGEELVKAILECDETDEQQVSDQRNRIAELKQILSGVNGEYGDKKHRLLSVADYLSRKSVWLFGGDGWAYDIGYGGLDHVLSTGADINVMVMDTEVYSNTGGQASKATPIGASAKFAAAGKNIDKKDLGLMAMSYGHVYVASIAMGANDNHTVKVMQEAESYRGPSLIIAYSHCIAHGYDLRHGLDQQKAAVACGVWPLYRYDPRRAHTGETPLQVDSKPPTIPVREYMSSEQRFRIVETIDPARFKRLAKEAQKSTEHRLALYRHMAEMEVPAAPESSAS